MLTDAGHRLVLLTLARQVIEARVLGKPRPPVVHEEVLARRAGAFVSLHANGDLRGCIGHVEPDQPLGVVIARCAIGACSADPRFPPVTAFELAAIQIELSVLGPLELVSGAADIEIGRHGIAVESGGARGLLLPQVAQEWSWDAETFLAHTCRKAGLSGNAHRLGIRIWRFEAEVFAEDRSVQHL